MYCTRSPLSNESPASSSSTHQHHHQHSISSVTTSFTKNGKRSKWQTIQRNVKRHGAFIGPGIIASVAYIDPGNWATDLQAGSSYGYSHLFVVLLSGVIALLFQLLAARLGVVTGLDLASHCRLALYDRPRHKMFYRWGILYPLYGLCEMGIIFTDMAELLGSAIAINLLFPRIPLSACVVLTSLDVFFILFIFDQYPARTLTRGMRAFEFMIGALVLVVLGSFVALLVKVSPVWVDVFKGYGPNTGMIKDGGLFIAIGILGATVMPHAFFIGSKIASVHRILPEQYEEYNDEEELIKPAPAPIPSTAAYFNRGSPLTIRTSHLANLSTGSPLGSPTLQNSPVTHPSTAEDDVDDKKGLALSTTTSSTIAPVQQESQDLPRSLACIRAHLAHAQIDIAGSLMGFAVVINSAILIVAAAVFYYGDDVPTNGGVTDLFDAFDLFKQYIGPAFAYIFAIALFASGQAASLTVTLSGQIISEGFIRWNTTPWKRRAITRAIGIVPSLAVALAVGREGIAQLLVGSQVALSFVLPFVVAPLLVFTTSEYIMCIPLDASATPLPTGTSTPTDLESSSPSDPISPSTSHQSLLAKSKGLVYKINPLRRRGHPDGFVSFVNPVIVVWLGWAFFTVINLANVVAIYEVAIGSG